MNQEAPELESPPEAATAASTTLTDRAYRELEEMIVTLRLEPGAVLSETALSRMLDIGRTPSAHIYVRDKLVARRHLRIFRRGGALFVEWLGSINGVYINDRRIDTGAVATRATTPPL